VLKSHARFRMKINEKYFFIRELAVMDDQICHYSLTRGNSE
jgi:hypothetical protein